jgi:SAM-dependent methyltransferase
VAAGERLPFRDGAFGTVVASEVLEHALDDAQIVREASRVLAPGGKLVVSVPAGPDRYGPLDRAVGHRRRYAKHDLRRLLAEAGMACEQLAGWGFPIGRLYDRWIQRPGLLAPGALRSSAAAVASGRWLHRVGGWVFAVDDLFPQGSNAAGWIAVARKI